MKAIFGKLAVCYMIRYKCREGDILAMVMVVVRVDQSSSESKLHIIWKTQRKAKMPNVEGFWYLAFEELDH